MHNDNRPDNLIDTASNSCTQGLLFNPRQGGLP